MSTKPKTLKKIQKLLNQAVKTHQANNVEAAEKIYREILTLNPNDPDALNLLGMIYYNKHELDEALKLHLAAINNKPGVANFHNNLGNVYFDLDQLDKALEQFNIALQTEPNYTAAINNLGNVYQRKNQLDKALVQYQQAQAIEPDLIEAPRNIANILWKLNRQQEAEQIYNTAMQGQVKDAIYYHNMGNIYRSQGRYLEAEQVFNQGLEIDQNYIQLHFDTGLLQLSQENFKEGWRNYSWGSRTKEESRIFFPLSTPMWDGSSVKNKTILIYGEQGIGDEIMFAQFIPEIASLAKKCILACLPRLTPLFSRSFSNIEIISGYNTIKLASLIEQKSVDFATPIGELAQYLRPVSHSFPKPASYLKANPDAINKWKKRYQALGNGLKIGISWKGGVQTQTSLPRTIDLEQWLDLLKIPDCHFINLQYGDQSQEIRHLKEKQGITLHHWEDSLPLKDMDDFAAQTAALDLVISIDNSTVHLAGALGVPTWLMLPFLPEWRWGINRQDSLWYSSITLFHQRILNDWQAVFKEIIERLTHIQNNKDFLPYLSFDQLPTALFVNNCSDQSQWGKTCNSIAIVQTLNKLLLNVDSVYSNELSQFNCPVDVIEEINNPDSLNHFCLGNINLTKHIQKADHFIINGEGLLGCTDKKALTLLNIALAAKIIYKKPVYLINLSIACDLASHKPVSSSIYQHIFNSLDEVATQDTLSSHFLTQIEVNHRAGFNCIPLYIENNYSLSPINKSNTIVLAGIDTLSESVLTELSNYIQLIGSNGFQIKLLVEAKTEIEPVNPAIKFTQSLLSEAEKNWEVVFAHDVNTWLTIIAEANLLISSQPAYLISASFIKTPCITLNSTPENEALTKTLNIHRPIESPVSDLVDQLIQNTLAVLDNPVLFLTPEPQLNALTELAKQNTALLAKQIQQKNNCQALQSYDIETLTSLAIQTLEAKQYTDAIELTNSALNQHKDNATFLYLLGLAHFHNNAIEKSLEFLFKSLKTNPKQVMVYEEIALILGDTNCPSINKWLQKLYAILDKNIQLFYATPKLLSTLLDSLHFNDPGVNHYKIQVYSEFVAPLLISSAQKTLPELALYLENTIYSSYLYQKDSQEFFAKNVCLWVKELENMGKAIAKKLPALRKKPKTKSDKKLITFFFHNESMLAHIKNITTLISSYNQLEHQPYKFKAYFLGGHHPEMRQVFKALNIKSFNLNEHYPNIGDYAHLLKLREHIAADNTALLIWGCLGTFMPFTFGMRIAPKQAWLSVKYKGIMLDSIDQYIQFSQAGIDQQIDNINWLSISTGGFNFEASQQELESAIEIRKKYQQHSILLGTFARETNIRDEAFLKAVVQILQNNKSCAYLWTGKKQDQFIQHFFESNNIADRTYFIGWVNTAAYASVIDIFLDTFTFMCGHTLLEAMTQKKASISFQANPDDLSSFQFHQVASNLAKGLYGTQQDQQVSDQIIKQSSNLFLAHDFNEYVNKANTLINNKQARERCGHANKRIVDYFFCNPTRISSSFIQILQSIIH